MVLLDTLRGVLTRVQWRRVCMSYMSSTLVTIDLWQALTSLEGGKSSAAEARACLATLWDEVRLRPTYLQGFVVHLLP